MEDAANSLTAAREAYGRGDWMVARDGFLSMLRGNDAFGSGWLSHAERALVGVPECVEHALLVYVSAGDALAKGDFEDALMCGG